MKDNKIYNTALYCRLSLDDGSVGESGSIQTQKIILEEYAKMHGFKIYDVYVDDGYSGLNFNRPGFQRMIQDIQGGKINLVITKDLSRLGRNYIETGYYTEHYFKDVGVRYIAINDSIDTINDNNDIAPFKNILNDMYSKDLSRKVKAAKKSRNQKGLYTAAQVPYGYKKDPIDNNHLIVDEEIRPIIKLIYRLALEGHGCPKIASILTEKGIYTPGYYERLKGDNRFARFKNKGWTYVTVRKTLGDVVYLGHIESKINKLEARKDKLYQLTKKVYDDALNEIIDSETSSKMIKEYQEEQKKITSEIETLKNLKQEEESTIENYKLLKEKVNEFLEFKELNSLIVHSLISRIEVGYRDDPRTIKIYYKFIDDSISN